MCKIILFKKKQLKILLVSCLEIVKYLEIKEMKAFLF